MAHQLGRWEHALAVAPAVSVSYWTRLCRCCCCCVADVVIKVVAVLLLLCCYCLCCGGDGSVVVLVCFDLFFSTLFDLSM